MMAEFITAVLWLPEHTDCFSNTVYRVNYLFGFSVRKSSIHLLFAIV